MKNRQGIVWAPILIIVATILVAGVSGYFLYKAGNTNESKNTIVAVVNQANSNTVTNQSVNSAQNTNTVTTNTNTGTNLTSSEFSYATVKAGDRIGAMTVEKVAKFTDDPQYATITPNHQITFSGQVTVTGRVESQFSEFGGQNQVCVHDLDQDSLSQIPKAKEDTRTVWFCLTNTSEALKSLPLGTNEIKTIVIKDYLIRDYPSEVFNAALFVSLSDSTAGWKTYTNTNLGFTLKYPAEYSVVENDVSTNPQIMWRDSSGTTKFQVQHRIDSVDGSLSTWFDTTPTDDIILGGRTGKKFVFQYCDGPGCGAETVAFVVQHKTKLLGLEFKGDKQVDATEEAIRNSFIFTN